MRVRDSHAAPPALPRSGVSIYCDGSLESLWVRIVIAEKDVGDARYISVGAGEPNHDLDTLNPERSVPTLADREVVLYPARLIVDYLDERYPHPPLMPVEPVARARLRSIQHHLERDLFGSMRDYDQANSRQRARAARAIRENLLQLSPLFPARGYLLGGEYSVIDAALAAIFWKIRTAKLNLDGTGNLNKYADRLLARPAVKRSTAAFDAQNAVIN